MKNLHGRYAEFSVIPYSDGSHTELRLCLRHGLQVTESNGFETLKQFRKEVRAFLPLCEFAGLKREAVLEVCKRVSDYMKDVAISDTERLTLISEYCVTYNVPDLRFSVAYNLFCEKYGGTDLEVQELFWAMFAWGTGLHSLAEQTARGLGLPCRWIERAKTAVMNEPIWEAHPDQKGIFFEFIDKKII